MRNALLTAAGFVLAIALFAFVSVLGAIPTYFLWNWLAPEVFALNRITFAQAWGLVWLTSILFKSASSGSEK